MPPLRGAGPLSRGQPPGWPKAVTVNDEAYQVALRHAKLRNISLGRAVSDLILRGAQADVRRNAGLLVFDPPKSFPPITPERVKRLAEEW